MKIKLKDNTELTVTESSTATKITADFSSAEDIENFRKKLTDENLSGAGWAFNMVLKGWEC